MFGYRFDEGDRVRIIRNIRNDGTYPGKRLGELLLERGNIGYIIDTGTFLQDQIIYSVHFLELGIIIGCREEELIDADEPWQPSRFQYRDQVITRLPLAIQGKIVIDKGTQGEIVKAWRDENSQDMMYHVYFSTTALHLENPSELNGHTLQIPEHALDFAS
jgi:nitrogen fixation protein NifZ